MMDCAISRRSRAFGRDERGVVLIMFTLFLVPLLLIVAVAIDFSQTLVVKRQLTAAVDAAALSVAMQPSLSDAQATDKAGDYIRAHYPSAAIGSLKVFNAVRDDNIVDVSATAELDTAFLRIAGYDKLSVTVNSRAMIKQTRLEVVMVLDNTGSMNDRIAGTRKIDALKSAANTLVDTLFGDATEAPFVKVGLVPFANAVNVGSGNRIATWMDTSNPSSLTTEHIPGGGFQSLFDVFAAMNVEWAGCVRARGNGYALTDEAPNPLNPATLFTPYFAPDETRGRSNSYFSNDDDKKFKSFTYYRRRPEGPGSPNYNCPESRNIQTLTNVKSTITSAIASMYPEGNTVIPEGLAWGWRVISPGVPFTQGAAYDDPETVKAIILLTDGRNDVSGGGNGDYKSVFTAFGYPENGHLGNSNGSDAEATLNSYTSTICQNIKANKDDDASDKDILLYTIVFGNPGQTISDIMRQCASEPSKYFNSPTAEDLQGAFESIALGLSKLRLAR
jgi:Flp pilus assembly protein TadG